MMNCRRILEEMNLYIDGTLEKELCEQLEAHLKGCESCRIVLDTTKKTIILYRDQTPVEVPQEVRNRLYQKIRAHWKKSR